MKQRKWTTLQKKRGVYVIVIEGTVEIDGEELGARDAIGLYDTAKFSLIIRENSKVLIIDIPVE